MNISKSKNNKKIENNNKIEFILSCFALLLSIISIVLSFYSNSIMNDELRYKLNPELQLYHDLSIRDKNPKIDNIRIEIKKTNNLDKSYIILSNNEMRKLENKKNKLTDRGNEWINLNDDVYEENGKEFQYAFFLFRGMFNNYNLQLLLLDIEKHETRHLINGEFYDEEHIYSLSKEDGQIYSKIIGHYNEIVDWLNNKTTK